MAIEPITASAGAPTAWTPAHEVERRLRSEILERPATARRAQIGDGIHVCPACRGPFVVPGEVYEVTGQDTCRLELRCADCGWQREAIYSDAELEELDRELDRGYADLLWALEVLWIGNEEEAIDRFRRALDADAILPEDF